jgi:hypothetical protein
MAKKKSESIAPGAKTLKEAGLESFEVVEIHRREIKSAAYNPRKIADQEREKLRAVLKKHGHVAPIVWNARTGNLVGGHQRLSITDALMGTDDYRLHVSKIDVDLPREKEINVALNNTAAQGSFDLEMLRDIFEDTEVSIEGAGFNHTDIVQMFGEDIFEDRTQDLKEFTEHLAEIATKYDAVQERNASKARGEKYLVFVFPDGAHVDAFLRAAGFEDNRYQNGLALMDKWGVVSPQK